LELPNEEPFLPSRGPPVPPHKAVDKVVAQVSNQVGNLRYAQPTGLYQRPVPPQNAGENNLAVFPPLRYQRVNP